EKGFIPGSINIGLNGQFAVWVGTLLQIDQPLILVTSPGKERESVLRLARVGYEEIKGFLDGGMTSWKGKADKVKSINAEQLKDYSNVEVLDVRKPGEWNTSHLKDAKFVPLSDMTSNLES